MIGEGIHAEVPGHPDVQLLIEHRMYHALIGDPKRNAAFSGVFEIRFNDACLFADVSYPTDNSKLGYKLSERIRRVFARRPLGRSLRRALVELIALEYEWQTRERFGDAGRSRVDRAVGVHYFFGESLLCAL